MTAQTQHKHLPQLAGHRSGGTFAWMYSTAGCHIAVGLMKLLPVHLRLSSLEIQNIREYFASQWVEVSKRKNLHWLEAFWRVYCSNFKRMAEMSKLARQDYYALNRQGSFAVKTLPPMEAPTNPESPHAPILIVPGLNTPSMFFREMHHYFTRKGFNVSVMTLPQHGFADVASTAEALHDEIERIKACCKVSQVTVIGHCLGGLVGQYYLEWLTSLGKTPSVKHLLTLGTGFCGAEGVAHLKQLWQERHPGKTPPAVFDELIAGRHAKAILSGAVAYHSILTIWDFMVRFSKGILEPLDAMTAQIQHASGEEETVQNTAAPNPEVTADMLPSVRNHIIEDPAIDHLTLALNPKVFAWIESILHTEPAQPEFASAVNV